MRNSTFSFKAIRLAILMLALTLAACSPPAPLAGPEAQPQPGTQNRAATAELTVQVSPIGAMVAVDGQVRGASPLKLILAPGDHQVAVSADGYMGITETVSLEAGQQGIYSPVLADIATPAVSLVAEPAQVPWLGQVEVHAAASDNAEVAELQVVLDGQLLGSAAGGELVLDLEPATVPGLEPGSTYTLTARAVDATGNEGQVSLPLIIGPLPRPTILSVSPTATASAQPSLGTPTPSPSPSPTPTATPAGTAIPSPQPTAVATLPPAVTYQVTQISIPTYPYTAYLRPTVDPGTFEYPLLVLDRAVYQAANPRPVPVAYQLIVLENRYLRLSILPDLGGRIYECVFKPTGNNEFYRNPVIKPTNWGPPSPPYPAGANWWLAVGGLEWGFPVEEHGYLWGTRWGYDIVTNPNGSVTVRLVSGVAVRPYVVVAVTLPADAAYFTVSPAIVNPNPAAIRFQWWADAMLAPGPANAPGPDLRFIVPTNEVTVHSTGDPTLPGPGQPLPWPVYGSRDLSRLGNWDRWLGFFERPAATGVPGLGGIEGYMGVYDTAADEGMVRVYPADVARGAKGFGMGWQNPIDWHSWTDDGSGYVELHGGLTPTFGDWYVLSPGGQVTWTETWYPLARIGGVSYAATGGAIDLAPAGNVLRVAIFPTKVVRGQLKLTVPGLAPANRAVDISPSRPFSEQVALTDAVPVQGEVSVALTDEYGELVLVWRGTARLR